MKLTPTTKRKAGMTLLELTVVILVLLSLISILFIGARAWKKGSDRAASILQIRNVQQAVRSYSNMNGFNPGETPNYGSGEGAKTLLGELFGSGKFLETNPVGSKHPAGGTVVYQYGEDAAAGVKIPDMGKLFITSSDGEYAPAEETHKDW